jgi:hypothetical protein
MPHEALQAALDARHDLGKYTSLNLRFLAPDADDAALREALLADLTQTRRGPDGAPEPAPAVWAACRARLGAALGRPRSRRWTPRFNTYSRPCLRLRPTA